MVGAGKRASGRKKTLAELGVARLPKARELWAKSFFAKRGPKARRMGEKTAVYSHMAMWLKWRALPIVERKFWQARMDTLRNERAETIRRNKSANGVCRKQPATEGGSKSGSHECGGGMGGGGSFAQRRDRVGRDRCAIHLRRSRDISLV